MEELTDDYADTYDEALPTVPALGNSDSFNPAHSDNDKLNPQMATSTRISSLRAAVHPQHGDLRFPGRLVRPELRKRGSNVRQESPCRADFQMKACDTSRGEVNPLSKLHTIPRMANAQTPRQGFLPSIIRGTCIAYGHSCEV
ncbi:hypothetical protein PoB_002854300 [Plakobranchus ocellatus]|uniref:Uncharacterized protein n=1 Tax=Plakobranchus ocellatus TaxID=259542 RepID=A0AAV4A5Y3_9GAST|nr:hypothetical protein PoB_002854300 [Plakobranchus ocellatus]